MIIKLRVRMEHHVQIYFEKTQDPEIQKALPSNNSSVKQALENYYKSISANSTSYGRTIYANDTYIGDIWCYCINLAETPQAMVSYCIFEKGFWNKGIASRALTLFLEDIVQRFQLKSIGAFTFSSNFSSIRVLEKNGFTVRESFFENGTESKYLQLEIPTSLRSSQ